MATFSLLKIGVIGSIVSALCCFTPLLVLTFSAIGLSSLIGLIDLVILPALFVFLGITAFALFKVRYGN